MLATRDGRKQARKSKREKLAGQKIKQGASKLQAWAKVLKQAIKKREIVQLTKQESEETK